MDRRYSSQVSPGITFRSFITGGGAAVIRACPLLALMTTAALAGVPEDAPTPATEALSEERPLPTDTSVAAGAPLRDAAARRTATAAHHHPTTAIRRLHLHA